MGTIVPGGGRIWSGWKDPSHTWKNNVLGVLFVAFPSVPHSPEVWGFSYVSWGDFTQLQVRGKVGSGSLDVQQERGFSTTVTF